MGLGGPVWHVSASPQSRGVTEAELAAACYKLLDGYGEPLLGEWTEMGQTAFHLRRRLSEVEQVAVGPVVDIRGTPEAARRIKPVRRILEGGGMGWLIQEEVRGR